MREHPDYRVVFTGHSLGGALATVAGADLRGNGYDIDVVCSKRDHAGKCRKSDTRILVFIWRPPSRKQGFCRIPDRTDRRNTLPHYPHQ